MKRPRNLAIFQMAVLVFCLQGCSRTLWREDSSTAPRPDLAADYSHQVLNSKSAEKQFAILETRASSRGKETLESDAVSALDALNLELSESPIENDALSEGLREIAVALLDDPSEEIRFRAAELLGKVATEDEESALLHTSKHDPSPSVQEMALEALELRGLGEEVWEE